jgi:ribosome-binding protein aMBF1 (putative translation factor)
MIVRDFDLPPDEEPDRQCVYAQRARVAETYDRWLEMKRSQPDLTQAEIARRLNLTPNQLRTALTRERRRRNIRLNPGEREFCEWRS